MKSHFAEKIERLCRTDMDAETFRHEVLTVLHSAIPFDACCWTLLDPDTLLPSHEIYDPLFPRPEQVRGVLQVAYQTEEPEMLRTLSQGQMYLRRFRASVQGDLSGNPLWEKLLRPNNLGDAMRVALSTGGRCWSQLLFYQSSSARGFRSEEERFLRRLIPLLATKLRQAVVSSVPGASTGETGPGVVLLSADLLKVSMTPLARYWVERLWPHWLTDTRLLPASVSALIARLEAVEDELIPAGWVSRLRIRARNEVWLMVQVERLSDPPQPDMFALTLQPAAPSQLQSFLIQARGLSRREREVTLLVLQGLSTTEIATALALSPSTVQDHLKAIFAKMGVRSRRELVACLQGLLREGAGSVQI